MSVTILCVSVVYECHYYMSISSLWVSLAYDCQSSSTVYLNRLYSRSHSALCFDFIVASSSSLKVHSHWAPGAFCQDHWFGFFFLSRSLVWFFFPPFSSLLVPWFTGVYGLVFTRTRDQRARAITHGCFPHSNVNPSVFCLCAEM